MSKLSARMFWDSNPEHIKENEKAAIQTILKSERAALLTEILVSKFAELDSSATQWLFGLFVRIIQKMTSQMGSTIDSMCGLVSKIGRQLTSDTVKSGSRKGEPWFLTKYFRDVSDLNYWDAIVYVYHFCNFEKDTRKYEAGVYAVMPTAKIYCHNNKLAAAYVGRFVKFLDEMKKTPMSELVNTDMLFETYPETKELIEWCVANRKKWDDFKEFYKENYEKGRSF